MSNVQGTRLWMSLALICRVQILQLYQWIVPAVQQTWVVLIPQSSGAFSFFKFVMADRLLHALMSSMLIVCVAQASFGLPAVA